MWRRPLSAHKPLPAGLPKAGFRRRAPAPVLRLPELGNASCCTPILLAARMSTPDLCSDTGLGGGKAAPGMRAWQGALCRGSCLRQGEVGPMSGSAALGGSAAESLWPVGVGARGPDKPATLQRWDRAWPAELCVPLASQVYLLVPTCCVTSA